jgi:hypothetical protein
MASTHSGWKSEPSCVCVSASSTQQFSFPVHLVAQKGVFLVATFHGMTWLQRLWLQPCCGCNVSWYDMEDARINVLS